MNGLYLDDVINELTEIRANEGNLKVYRKTSNCPKGNDEIVEWCTPGQKVALKQFNEYLQVVVIE